MSRFFRYLKQLPTYGYVIVLINDLSPIVACQLISRLDTYRQVKVILLTSLSDSFSASHLQPTNRTIRVFHDYSVMFDHLQQIVNQATEEFDNGDSFIIYNRAEKALRDLREHLGSFLWTNTFRLVLLATPYDSLEAKTDMLNACREFFRRNSYRLHQIDRFEKDYQVSDAIRWYTKESFLYHIINRALRSEDPFVLYTFRYYIFALSQELARNRLSLSEPIRLYRGTRMHRVEVESLTVGALVAVNGFFSSSRDINVAKFFAGISDAVVEANTRSRSDTKQCVLFEIIVDLNISPDLIVADVSAQSEMRDEKEMLFDLGTTFQINQIQYDPKQLIWNVQLIHSSEKAQLVREYDEYIAQRLFDFHPHVLFGRILITNLAEYSHASEFFHRLLRTINPQSEVRATIYYELARIYRFQGQYEKALEYFHRAVGLQQIQLPISKFAYAMTLAGIATVYLERNQAEEALTFLKQADEYFNEYPFDYNYETIFQANRFSYAYYLTKEYDKALNLLDRALDAYERKMPCDHPSHAQAWHNIGLVQRARGQYDPAKKAFQEALRMRKARLSSDHPYIARTHYQMSLLYEEIGI